MRTLIALLVLLTGAASAMTVQETTDTIRGKLDLVIAEIGQGDETWGEQQALEDLRGLSAAAAALEAYLDEGDPTRLEGLSGEVARLANRARTSSVMLSLSPEGARTLDEALALSFELDGRLRELRNRFDGRLQPGGETLSHTPLEGQVGPAVYQSPEELLREARSVRMLAQELRTSWPGWGWGYNANWFGRGYTDPLDVREVLDAAYRFESTVQAPYSDVTQTHPAYERLRRAFYRAGLDFSMNDQPAARQLRRAMDRLEAFYGSL